MTAVEYTLQNRLKNYEQRLRVLERTPRLAFASISEGGLTIRNGGGLTIEDGGTLLAYHPNGQRAFYVGPVSGGDADNYAFLVENPEGGGMIRYYRFNDEDYVYLGYEGDRPVISAYGQRVKIRSDPDPLDFNATEIGMWTSNEARFYGKISYEQPYQTKITGGSNPAGNGIQSSVVFPGNDRYEVWIRDGGNASYRPIVASNVSAPSSVEMKDELGDLEDGALDTVKRIPIHRWRYAEPIREGVIPPDKPIAENARTRARGIGEDDQPVQARNDTAPANIEPEEQIGPYAEEVPLDMGTPDAEDPADRRVNLNASLWMLWKAVQELSDKVDQLETRLERGTP